MWKPDTPDSRSFSLRNRSAGGFDRAYPISIPSPATHGSEGGLPFQRALLLSAAILIIYLGIWYTVKDNSDGYTLFSNLGYISINIISILCLLYAAYHSREFNKRFYTSWMILAVAQSFWALGDIIYAYNEMVLKESLFPSLSDGAYIMRYILFIVGILVLPTVNISSRERFKTLLDMAIVMIVSVLLLWTLIITPTIQQNLNADRLSLALLVAYPVMDLMLLFALVDLLFRRLEFSTQRSITLISASTFLLVLADSIYNIEQLNGTYGAGGGLLDIGWPLAYILIGLAGLSYADTLRSGAILPHSDIEKPNERITWPLYLPYICAGGAYIFLILSQSSSIPSLSFTTISWFVGAIIALVVVRQVLALKENISLYNAAQQEIIERKVAEKEIVRLNEVLEDRVAKRTFELEAANKDLQKEIIEHKEAEKARRDSEQRLADIINFLPDATVVINRKGEVIAWNRAMETLTGVKGRDILGKGNYEYSLPFYGERRPMLIDLVLNPDPHIEETYVEIKRQEDNSIVGVSLVSSIMGKSIYLMGGAAVLYDLEGNIFGAIESLRDISERMSYEETLKCAKEKAEAATRAKSDFLANMSHEIRTPMNAIIGMTRLLMETSLLPEQRDWLQTISNSGNGLLAIINDILDFSKIDSGKMILESQSFDLAVCIETSIDMVSAEAAEKRIELAYLIETNVPGVICGDANRLRQVLVNLLVNAVKFTDTGEVVLSVSASLTGAGEAELLFSVKDTGIGISKDNLDKIFQSFTQADSSSTRNYGGTGLGLAISKRLVELMGGKIGVESEEGIGSTFYFSITAKAMKSDELSVPSDLAGKSVLIEERNDTIRGILVKYVQSWGMKAVESTSEKEAYDILEENRFDIVILDEVLTDNELISLGRRMRMSENAKAILILMHAINQKVQMEPYISGWLAKPVKPHNLLSLIRENLPLKEDLKATVPDEPASIIPAEENHNLNILLSEDNPVNQKVALCMLKRLGYKADVASNGLEVLQALEEKPYDIILMDIQMPQMDGIEATRCIRGMKNTAKQPSIIAMTAHTIDGDREKCLNAGMDDYISKPIDIELLRKAIKQCSEVQSSSG